MKPIIGILGEGAWGSAMAQLAALNGATVYLWCYHSEIAEEIKHHRTNCRYIPYLEYHSSIIPTTDLGELFAHASVIFEAIPVQYLRNVVKKAAVYHKEHHQWVVLSKGIEDGSGFLPTQIISEECRLL